MVEVWIGILRSWLGKTKNINKNCHDYFLISDLVKRNDRAFQRCRRDRVFHGKRRQKRYL